MAILIRSIYMHDTKYTDDIMKPFNINFGNASRNKFFFNINVNSLIMIINYEKAVSIGVYLIRHAIIRFSRLVLQYRQLVEHERKTRMVLFQSIRNV